MLSLKYKPQKGHGFVGLFIAFLFLSLMGGFLASRLMLVTPYGDRLSFLSAGSGRQVRAPEESRQPETIRIFTRENLRVRYRPYGLVAHAFGSVNGLYYTNCREAFEESYRKGFRVFEVDLVLLADGTVYCAHNDMEGRYRIPRSFRRCRWEEVERKKLYGKYTPLLGEGLVELARNYDDAFFILDTKYSHLQIVKALVTTARGKDSTVLNRFIPHIAGPEDHLRLQELFPFPNYMLALYRSRLSNRGAVEFIKNSGVRGVMMWWNKRYRSAFQKQLEDAGAAVYVHSLNDAGQIDRFRRKGVGVYSDGFYPSR